MQHNSQILFLLSKNARLFFFINDKPFFSISISIFQTLKNVITKESIK